MASSSPDRRTLFWKRSRLSSDVETAEKVEAPEVLRLFVKLPEMATRGCTTGCDWLQHHPPPIRLSPTRPFSLES
ncbi:hypothetical protein E4U30_006228 [Claviceps sp. LM220 group G6]|nr:hypothetical protein E4U30_006228 [Claviceps sp. LM220 group G6]